MKDFICTYEADDPTNPMGQFRTKVLTLIHPDDRLWDVCAPYIDAYGDYLPDEWDWSGFRDSSDEAIKAMARAMGLDIPKEI